MRDVDGSLPESPADLLERTDERQFGIDFDIRRRLVEQDHFRLPRHRSANSDLLAGAGIKLVDKGACPSGHVDDLEHLVDPFGALGCGNAGIALQRQGDVLAHRQRRVHDRILKHHANVAPPWPHPGHIGAVDDDAAFARRFKAGNHPHQRGLAAARGSQKARRFAIGKGDVKVVDGGEGAKALRDAVNDDAGFAHGAASAVAAAAGLSRRAPSRPSKKTNASGSTASSTASPSSTMRRPWVATAQVSGWPSASA